MVEIWRRWMIKRSAESVRSSSSLLYRSLFHRSSCSYWSSSFSILPSLSSLSQSSSFSSSPLFSSSSSSFSSSVFTRFYHHSSRVSSSTTSPSPPTTGSTTITISGSAAGSGLSNSSSLDEDSLNDLSGATVIQYANRPSTGVTLRQMFSHGQSANVSPAMYRATLLQTAQFLHKEMGVRLAKRLRELDDLPFGLSMSDEIQRVRRLYSLSFMEAIRCPYPTNESTEILFTNVIKRILTRHNHIVVLLARGMRASFWPRLNRQQREHFLLQEFLDRFNISRIGIRVIMAQHIALHSLHEDYVGIIHAKCDPKQVIQRAVLDASALCVSYFGVAPEVQVDQRPANLTFRYVPTFLRYIIFELLKNSMRAVVEHHYKPDAPKGSNAHLPPIKIVVVDGDHDVTIKVSDCGGGIKRSDLPLAFTYSYTTPARIPVTIPPPPSPAQLLEYDRACAEPEWLRGMQGQIINFGAPMFGDAFGLPLARLHARYFGGDLQLHTLPGHGMDAYLYLNKLGNTDEELPE